MDFGLCYRTEIFCWNFSVSFWTMILPYIQQYPPFLPIRLFFWLHFQNVYHNITFMIFFCRWWASINRSAEFLDKTRAHYQLRVEFSSSKFSAQFYPYMVYYLHNDLCNYWPLRIFFWLIKFSFLLRHHQPIYLK